MVVPYYSEGNTDRNAPSQHPISPPSELVQRWTHFATENGLVDEEIFAAHAAQWGWDQRAPEIQAAADQEREAICEWLRTGPYGASIACHAEQLIFDLQYARRPKPPSLKERLEKAIVDGDERTALKLLEAFPDEYE